jgi:peptidylprolyl isomerase
MKKRFLLVCLIIASFYSCKGENSDLADGLYAKLKNNKGDNGSFRLQSTITVANFVSLAEGENDFVKYLKGHVLSLMD